MKRSLSSKRVLDLIYRTTRVTGRFNDSEWSSEWSLSDDRVFHKIFRQRSSTKSFFSLRLVESSYSAVPWKEGHRSITVERRGKTSTLSTLGLSYLLDGFHSNCGLKFTRKDQVSTTVRNLEWSVPLSCLSRGSLGGEICVNVDVPECNRTDWSCYTVKIGPVIRQIPL